MADTPLPVLLVFCLLQYTTALAGTEHSLPE